MTQPAPLTVQYGVITAVPDPSTDDSNLRSAMVDVFVKIGRDPNGIRDIVKLLPDVVGPAESLKYLLENFHVGQILVLDHNGREYAFPGRKPSEWNATCEHFPTVEGAIARARQTAGS